MIIETCFVEIPHWSAFNEEFVFYVFANCCGNQLSNQFWVLTVTPLHYTTLPMIILL